MIRALYGFLLFLFAVSFPVFAQEEEPAIQLPQGLGIANQLKYSTDIDTKREIFENWLNVDYASGIFTAGMRFDIFQPMDNTLPLSLGKSRYGDISFKYIRAETGDADAGAELTVGNYYALFGRGLILKSYEDRNVRIDNNLLGVKLISRYAGFTITALSGSPENSDATRTDLFHAIDVEYKIFKTTKAGISFASNQGTAGSRNKFVSFRAQHGFDFGDLYVETGGRQNDDISNSKFKGAQQFVGKAFYAGGSLFYDVLSLTAEYKHYDNFASQSQDASVNYNTAPSTRKDYTYLLLNRHPSPMNQNNEKGILAEITAQYTTESSFSLAYGITNTLPASSLYQRMNKTSQPVRTQFKEIFGQWYHHWDEQWSTVAALGYNEELDKNTKNITPIFEARYYFDDVNTMRTSVEHQSTHDRNSKEKFFVDVFMIEFLHAPSFSLTWLGELETREPLPGNVVRKMWNLLQFGFKVAEHTDVNVLIGSRQEGSVCIGGVCRYEPAFSGIELKMMTRL